MFVNQPFPDMIVTLIQGLLERDILYKRIRYELSLFLEKLLINGIMDPRQLRARVQRFNAQLANLQGAPGYQSY